VEGRNRLVRPCIAFDLVDAIFTRKKPKWWKFWKGPTYDVIPFGEQCCICLRDNYNVAILCDCSIEEIEKIRKELMPGSYTYLVPCRNEGEYRLFVDTFCPMYIFSNLPEKFQCVPLGATPFQDTETLFRMIHDLAGV